MRQNLLSAGLVFAATAFLLISCGDSGSGENENVESHAADSAAVAPAPVNTIITTPQDMVVVTHKIADFSKWKPAYDSHDSARLANGLHSYVIGRGIQDTNTTLVALKADDLAKAKVFAKNPDLKKAMEKGGVKGAPTIEFVTAVWQDTSNVGSIPRSMTTFTIKDWDSWLKNFEDGKQERLDNGITVRMVGHDADDNKKVVLVTALTDTAKAFAYFNSDALKKRREAGGVVSEPKRFLFNIAARY